MSDWDFTIRVTAAGLTGEQQSALLDRVASAAHAFDERVSCAVIPRGEDDVAADRAEIRGLQAAVSEAKRRTERHQKRLQAIRELTYGADMVMEDYQ